MGKTISKLPIEISNVWIKIASSIGTLSNIIEHEINYMKGNDKKILNVI